MAPEGDPAVAVSGLTHRFGSTRAVADVSLAIPAGSSTAMIGPDGVGKSTLLSLIAGVRKVQAGEVSVFDGSMRERAHRDATAARIAYMPQGLGRNLYPTLSVVENIDFHARLFGQGARERRARTARLLRATGLDPFPDRPAGKLSGGMKQKLSLCCALVHDPDLLILDEPTTGVDPLSRRQFWELIEEIRAERPGMTLLVATAYMDEAARFERLIAVDDGRIIAQGRTREILQRTGAATLDEAYARLQQGDQADPPGPFIMPPRVQHDGAPAMAADGLTRRFGDFTAVDHVSFLIERGEIFGFLGSNGCGKTTTMKMLTGLLPADEGTAELLGQPIDASDMKTRMRVGYMSQSFSLYEELSVRANLVLHAQLYRIPAREVAPRVDEALARFDLADVAETFPGDMPLGKRQRLQLAAACLHRPEVLILDEPTSGVDPAARDLFWHTLADLSRKDGVTIFVSTHFMNEAERCDRISLMHAGRVLAVGTPQELTEKEGAQTLEDAFIRVLERESEAAPPSAPTPPSGAEDAFDFDTHSRGGAVLSRVWAFARREALEVVRDKVRLAFAVVAPLLLLVVFGLGISFDVENLTYAVFDRDQSIESRAFLEEFSSSRFFLQKAPVTSDAEVDRRLSSGELRFVIGVPPGFGRDLLAGRKPEISAWIDGANTFRAETVKSYLQGAVLHHVGVMARENKQPGAAGGTAAAVTVEPRFNYNQAFLSVNAIAPGTIMLLSMLVPAMMTALGVVREREIGSIANLQASPAGVPEFLIGKQLPYALIGMVSLVSMALLTVLVFGVPFKGSAAAFLTGGALYVLASTAFGLLVSTLVKTQVAAMFATAIITVLPSINFSGFLYPLASVEGAPWLLGVGFPSSWFQTVTLGAFAKGLGMADLWTSFLALGGFGLLYVTAACLILDKQEA